MVTKKYVFSALLMLTLLIASIGDCRVGGGRSFGTRGSRGFSLPSTLRGGSPPPSYGYGSQSSPYRSQQAVNQLPGFQPPSIMKSLGAGLAGGFLGSMLYRAIGGGYSGFHSAGGSFGPLEIILLGVFLFWAIRLFTQRSQPSPEGATSLMKQARPFGWSARNDLTSTSQEIADFQSSSSFQSSVIQNPLAISSELAMDLFFQIQGCWGNRELSPIQNILDADAKDFLEKEVAQLRANRRINRLENIAIRKADIVESWQESGKTYSTVQFTANLLDFVINEDSHQLLEGSQTSPVKFEEFWTFSKEIDSPNWKLSAIQQA